MEFGFTAEQTQLRDTVRSFLDRHVDSERVRAADGFDAALWRRLADEVGLAALVVPEEQGGFGASQVEAGVVLEEAGRALVPAPLLSTLVTTAAIDPNLAPELLTEIAQGKAIAALAVAEPDDVDPSATRCVAHPDGDGYRIHGIKEHVLDGQVADLVVVSAVCDGRPGLYAVRTEDAVRTPHDTLDLTRRQARLEFDAAPAVRVGTDPDRAWNVLWAALAVESVGVARASLEQTIEYMKTRRQFGVPLAHFQALRHRVADLFTMVEAATSSAWYALRVAHTAEFSVAAPLAKLVATRAAYAVTAESIQLHGGIGFTWEHDAHLYFKRATANRLLFCDEVRLRQVIAARAELF